MKINFFIVSFVHWEQGFLGNESGKTMVIFLDIAELFWELPSAGEFYFVRMRYSLNFRRLLRVIFTPSGSNKRLQAIV